eukprot:snap_masked-scaffold_21-processed-gene-2.28-mRNA-1 protein AED:1.00 eAED:1.00 QI:0/0/0/0/1/1/2/0/105
MDMFLLVDAKSDIVYGIKIPSKKKQATNVSMMFFYNQGGFRLKYIYILNHFRKDQRAVAVELFDDAELTVLRFQALEKWLSFHDYDSSLAPIGLSRENVADLLKE